MCMFLFFFFKQKTAYEMRISDWSSDVCSSDLGAALAAGGAECDGAGRRGRAAAGGRLGRSGAAGARAGEHRTAGGDDGGGLAGAGGPRPAAGGGAEPSRRVGAL